MMLELTRRLARLGIMGINLRNADFTLALNPRRYYPLVDDKLTTKRLALEAGIPVPELYGNIERESQVRFLDDLLQNHEDFVVKPAHGSGGDGILVVTGRAGHNYRTAGGLVLTREELDHHIFSILSGLYSLGGQTDNAMIEYRVQFDPVFEAISYQGVPDVRIIVFLGVPIMAMLRLPTRLSGGKANLHQGAIGVGIAMASGTTLGGVARTGIVSEHPDTGNPVSGITVPHWEAQMLIAARAYELTGLGYLGADLVLDKFKGPLLLELNARPGLGIQIANRAGLMPRVNQVRRYYQDLVEVAGPEARVAFAREHFGAQAAEN
jgi:alpha-L-glutamate ligase-like protein